jgi:O-antigen ligase
MAMAVVDPPSALFRSDQGALIVEDKQIIPSGMLAGFLTQPNNLGQFIVLGLPALFLIRRRWLRLAYFLIGAFTIVWTASRTSLYALAMMCLAAALLWSTRGRGARRTLSIGMITIPFAAVCALPLVTTDPSSYSERGFIWQASLPFWYSNPWFGQGANWYRDLATTSGSIASSAFQGHNQLVQLLVTGGLLYAIFTGAMILLASSAAVRLAESGVNYGVVYLVALAGTCLLEVSLVTVDNSSMFPVVVIPLAVILFGHASYAGRRGAGGSRYGTTGAVLPRVFVAHNAEEAEYDA